MLSNNTETPGDCNDTSAVHKNHLLLFKLTDSRMFTITVWTDDRKLLQESNVQLYNRRARWPHVLHLI